MAKYLVLYEPISLLSKQEKHVNTVAVGIGPNVDKDKLKQIASDGPVVQVEDFNQLEKMLATIKSSACSSGTSEIEQT